jgi:hypothetical protein
MPHDRTCEKQGRVTAEGPLFIPVMIITLEESVADVLLQITKLGGIASDNAYLYA